VTVVPVPQTCKVSVASLFHRSRLAPPEYYGRSFQDPGGHFSCLQLKALIEGLAKCFLSPQE
jgi:hypothetical protein